MREKLKKHRARYIAILLAAVIVVFGIIPYAGAAFIYEQYFGIRYETKDIWKFYVSDFDGLKRTESDFVSNEGQKLAGYLYSTDKEKQRGVVVFGHGFGCGGHTSYMPYINYFAQHGYYVFAYDATGNDESEGSSIRGLPQQVIDMDYAISHVEELEETKDLPLMLWGHSWGGYTVTNELNKHPEVKAVVSVAGFDRSTDLIRSWGEDIAGPAVNLLMPYVRLYEWSKFGDDAATTAQSGFENSDAAVMVYQEDLDNVVPRKYGYDIWYEEYGDDPRFSFHLLEGLEGYMAHNYIYDSEEIAQECLRVDETDGFDEWLATLDYDYESPKNQNKFMRDKSNYFNENLPREEFVNRINEEMFDEMLAFYDSHLD